MYPSAFDYHRATSLNEAVSLFSELQDASFLAGGHTLIPAMRNRLSMPTALIDVRSIPELHGISCNGSLLTIGAATTHANVAHSPTVRDAIPALSLLAGSIADPQVRNLGTLGGSVANNDPSADYPAAVLGLNATIVTNKRHIGADEFFAGLFTTSLETGELIVKIEFPIPLSAGYAKICSQASRYAMAGSFVVRDAQAVRVAITGAGGNGVFRWGRAETALARMFGAETLDGMVIEADELISDLHGDARYRAALVSEITKRAVANMGSVDIR